MWRAAVRAGGAAAAGAARRAAAGPATLSAPAACKSTSAHALVEQYVTKGVLHPDDIDAKHLATLAKLPRKEAIEAVREFVKEAGGPAARTLTPAERSDIMGVVLQPRVVVEASREWVWRDYDRVTHPVNVDKRFVNHGAPPSNQYITMMDPEVEPESLVPTHFDTVSLTMVGFDHSLLDSYVEFIQRAGAACGVDMSGRVPLPTRIEKFTLLKSPHVHKKHRSQYETRTHRRLVQMRRMSGPTASAFLDYVVRLCPPGVELRLAHTTVESPSGELADALGWPAVPDASALSQEIRRVVEPADVPPLLDALGAHARGGGVEGFKAVPARVFGNVRLTAGLRDFLLTDGDRAAFDAVVESALSRAAAAADADDNFAVDAAAGASAPTDDVDDDSGGASTDAASDGGSVSLEGVTREDLEAMDRRQLQNLAKQHGVAANGKTTAIVDELLALANGGDDGDDDKPVQ